MVDQLYSEAQRYLSWARTQGAELDHSDESILFVQGVLESMASNTDEPPSHRATKSLAYGVYLAEVLARTCAGVQVVIDGENLTARDVLAVGDDGTTQFTLSWVRKCLDNPRDNTVVFKFIGALRDYGENTRATQLAAQLRDYEDFANADAIDD